MFDATEFLNNFGKNLYGPEARNERLPRVDSKPIDGNSCEGKIRGKLHKSQQSWSSLRAVDEQHSKKRSDTRISEEIVITTEHGVEKKSINQDKYMISYLYLNICSTKQIYLTRFKMIRSLK